MTLYGRSFLDISSEINSLRRINGGPRLSRGVDQTSSLSSSAAAPPTPTNFSRKMPSGAGGRRTQTRGLGARRERAGLSFIYSSGAELEIGYFSSSSSSPVLLVPSIHPSIDLSSSTFHFPGCLSVFLSVLCMMLFRPSQENL